MINVEEIKTKILGLLEKEGPLLPIQVSRNIKLEPLFTSAILSELVSTQKIKLSNLRIGSSPLYLIPGQEQKLEKFASENLKGIEKTAYLRLKEEKIIEDVVQEPAMRVALRSLKDFAIPLRFQEKTIWKYVFVTNEEVRFLLSPNPQKEITNSPIKEKEKIIETKKPQKEPEEIFEKKEIKSSKKIKPNQEDFLNEIKDFLKKRNIEIIKEVEIKKKEITLKIKINSDIGKLNYLLIGKDKKRPSLADLSKAKKESMFERIPCYFISRGEPVSTTKEFLEENKDLIKITKL